MPAKKESLKTASLRELGAEIRSSRLQRGLTQSQLAELIGHNQREYIRCVESGLKSPNLNTLYRIAKALDMDLFIGFIPNNAS